jgi:hypothetical protein
MSCSGEQLLDHHDGSQHESGTGSETAQSAIERVPLLDVASTVTVSVEILKESHDEILAIARESGYSEDEAVLLVLLSGLGYESGRLHLDALNRAANLGTELSPARVEAIVNELAGYHSMYSVLKYKTFKLYKQNQRLEFNNAGLRAQEQMWQEWSDRMRKERESLRDEVLRLKSILSEFSLNWEASGDPPLPQAVLDAAQLPKEPEPEPEPEHQVLSMEDYAAPDVEVRRGLWWRVVRFFRQQ